MMPPDFSWWNVLPTLVGGAISLVTSIVMFGLAQFIDRKKRTNDRLKEEAIAAFVGFWKLKAVAETLGNLSREISEAFANADQRGMLNANPCDFVRGFVGASSQMEFLTAKELLFLNRSKRSELMTEADLIVRRALNIEESMRKYGELRAELQTFIENNAANIDLPVGTSGGFSMSGKAASIAQLKRSSLNDLLHQIQKMLDTDAPHAKIIATGYLRIARECFGNNFPKFEFEWV